MNLTDTAKRIEWDNLVHKIKWNIQWVNLSKKELPIEFIRIYKDKLSWSMLIQYHQFTKAELKEFKDYYDEQDAIIYQKNIPEHELEKYAKDYDEYYTWRIISERGNLSEKFIEKYRNDISWTGLTSSQELSEKFLTKMQGHLRHIGWFEFFEKQQYLTFSKDFYKHFNDMSTWYDFWDDLSDHLFKEKSVNFKWIDKVGIAKNLDWERLFTKKHSNITEKTLEKYFEYFTSDCWYKLGQQYKNISKDTIKEYLDDEDFDVISSGCW